MSSYTYESQQSCLLQAGLRTLQDLAPEMRLAMAMEEEEGLEGEITEEEEFFRVRTPDIQLFYPLLLIFIQQYCRNSERNEL